jgi:hypothetical protein
MYELKIKGHVTDFEFLYVPDFKAYSIESREENHVYE